MQNPKDDFVLVLGSKPNSFIPNLSVKRIYSANGAAERAEIYRKKFNNVKAISVVSDSVFNKLSEVRDRVVNLNPDIIYCRYGEINKKLIDIKPEIINKTRFSQLLWQSKFFKNGIFQLLISELYYEDSILKKLRHLYDCLRWRGFLCSSTGLYAILLALEENPNSKIIISGIGINSGGETFYGSNKEKVNRHRVDKKLFFKLKPNFTEKLITCDFEMHSLCSIPLWKGDRID